jgi:hypothetical protein
MASRILLGVSSFILLAGGVIHAMAFRRFDPVANALPPFYANASRALWLIDSATQLVLAAAFAWLAARPEASTPVVVAFMALIPAATAVLIYAYVGNFAAGHLLAAAAATSLAAAALSAWR